MTATTQKPGYIILSFGRSVIDILNEPLHVIWEDKEVADQLKTLSFHGDPDSPPTLIPVTLGVPIEIDDGFFNQQRRVEAPRRNARLVMPMPEQAIRQINAVLNPEPEDEIPV